MIVTPLGTLLRLKSDAQLRLSKSWVNDDARDYYQLPRKTWNVNSQTWNDANVTFTLEAGSVIRLERILVKKGPKENTLTFRMQLPHLRRTLKFDVLLEDANQMDVEVVTT